MPLSDPRTLQKRVLHGLVAEWGLALAILLTLGPGAFVFFVAQAFIAVRLLEAVNYFEHWGLVHADHHAHGEQPYQQLRPADASDAPWLHDR